MPDEHPVIEIVEKKQGPPRGSQFWKKATVTGRKAIFNTKKELLKACKKYFEWVDDNPLLEQKVFHTDGKITKTNITKMRAMTINGLCLFLGIDSETWAKWRAWEPAERSDPEREILSDVVEMVENIIYEQKFTGAAADLLNGNIIGRELGLKEHSEITGELGIMTIKDLTDDNVTKNRSPLSDTKP